MRQRDDSLQRWHQLPCRWHAEVVAHPGSVLLQTARFDTANQRSLIFLNPLQIIAAYSLDEIPELFRQVDQTLADGSYVAGFLSYECGYHFERFEQEQPSAQGLPLAWFGVYKRPLVFDHTTGCFNGETPIYPEACATPSSESLSAPVLAIEEEAYRKKIERIKEYIGSGDTYQVNFTTRVAMPAPSDAAANFARLLLQQPVAYSAFLNAAGHQILSLSPELFFRTERGRITTRPMKGTMPRGLDVEGDRENAIHLQNDEKNRSEHVMIVDLLRNDLGRICGTGSVKVEDLFSIEQYATLLQMTSTVSGTLRSGLRWYDIFKAMFPSGSITGAPKIRTMQIIHELEEAPRGIYTGSIGYIAPDGTSAFNVAIRTLCMHNGKASMGVGGGIVADSQPRAEYEECLLKAAFLTSPGREFQLIETMLWNGSFQYLSMHMDRLESSAAYFDFAFNRGAAISQLVEYASHFHTKRLYRVRLLLHADGTILLRHTEHSVNPASAGFVRIASQRTSSTDVFLRHKTTQRQNYDLEYAQCRSEGFDEVIFQNEKDEITEGAISNIFLRSGDRLLTPPLRCGILPGVFRRHLIETNPHVEESMLTMGDLQSADAIYICNSLRGLREVRLIPDPAADDLHRVALTVSGS